jgi:hypothetical protein
MIVGHDRSKVPPGWGSFCGLTETASGGPRARRRRQRVEPEYFGIGAETGYHEQRQVQDERADGRDRVAVHGSPRCARFFHFHVGLTRAKDYTRWAR